MYDLYDKVIYYEVAKEATRIVACNCLNRRNFHDTAKQNGFGGIHNHDVISDGTDRVFIPGDNARGREFPKYYRGVNR